LFKATIPSSQVRKIIVEKIYKDPDLEKIAYITSSIVVRTVNRFLIKASGISGDKTKMFATEEEALKWLRA